jgi:glycopeptide antibiotics resistance protein
MRNTQRSSLSCALLIYMCIIVILITLIPFSFRRPDEFHISWSADFEDFLTNIILFLPIGFLFRLSRRKSKDRFCMQALGFGILMSSTIEFTQFFVPGRYTQVSDVMANATGAWLGAVIFVLMTKMLKEDRTVRLLTLELPLMNIVYLIIPLMWLNGLSAGGEAARLWLMLLLGLFGSGILVSVYIHRLRNNGEPALNKLSLFAVTWFIVASLPILINFPIEIVSFGIIIGILVQIPARFPVRKLMDERRFELTTLKILLPLYVIYVILLAVWPTTLPFQDWQFKINFQELTFNARIVFTFRFIERVAAFTLFGYMVAEMRGRKAESLIAAFAWVFVIVFGTSVMVETIRVHPPLLGSDILEVLLMVGAGVYGSVIYRLQLAEIRQIGTVDATKKNSEQI